MRLFKKIKKILKPFKDSLIKKSKIAGKNQYTVLCTVYNVEKYLNDFFESMIAQTLNFEDHIYLLMVDDGSPDNSADIIKNWQNRYPDNIIYIKKENGGQQSAFNFGLEYVKTPWVTFIDPDDTVNERYFEVVDQYSDNNIDMISTNMIFYFEDTKKYKPHYLSYRYKKNIKVVNPQNMQGYIQSTIACMFIKMELINKEKLTFDERIVPTFYDCHFVNKLLIKNPQTNIAFVKNAIYYYRKREDNSSIINNAWIHKGRYLDAIEFGLLDLLEESKFTYFEVPIYLQRFSLYLIQYYYKRIVNDGDNLEFLTQDEIKKFKHLLIEMFSYIDAEVIEVCALGGLWHKYRVGFYNLYKNQVIFKQVCYIDGYDKFKKELKVHYYYHSDTQEVFLLNGKRLQPRIEEVTKHNFLGEVFVYEKIIYLPLAELWGYFDIKLGNIETQISLNKKRYTKGIQINDLIKKSI